MSSLAGGDKHGYALLQDIAEFAGVTLGPGLGLLGGAAGALLRRAASWGA